MSLVDVVMVITTVQDEYSCKITKQGIAKNILCWFVNHSSWCWRCEVLASRSNWLHKHVILMLLNNNIKYHPKKTYFQPQISFIYSDCTSPIHASAQHKHVRYQHEVLLQYSYLCYNIQYVADDANKGLAVALFT